MNGDPDLAAACQAAARLLASASAGHPPDHLAPRTEAGPPARVLALFRPDSYERRVLDGAQRTGTSDSAEALASILKWHAEINEYLAADILSWTASRHAERTAPPARNWADAYSLASADIGLGLRAGRDVFGAGRDITINYYWGDGPRRLASDVARVLRDLDLTSRGSKPREKTPGGRLALLLGGAIAAAVGREPGGQARRSLLTALQLHGIDPRAIIPRLTGQEEAIEGWRARADGPEMAAVHERFRQELAERLCRDVHSLLPEQASEWLTEALAAQEPVTGPGRDFLHALDKMRLRPPGGARASSPGAPRTGAARVPGAERPRAEVRREVRQLPAVTARMTGRHEEVEEIASAITRRMADSRSATVFLSGQPGVGKSAVAMEVARRLEPSFPGGTLYFDVRGIDAQGIDLGRYDMADLGRVARAVKVTPQRVAAEVITILDEITGTEDEAARDDDELYARYAAVLRDRQMLIVLDNALDVGHVRPLLRGARSSCVIVTTRDKSFGKPPAVDIGVYYQISKLVQADSVALLTKFGDDCGGGLTMADGFSGICGKIAHYCDNLPLSLCLVGNQMLSRCNGDIARVRRLVRQLEDESRRLGVVGIGPVISLSYLSLQDDTRRVFRMSCTTRGVGITADELGFCMDMDAIHVEDELFKLVDGSLATDDAITDDGPVAFTLHQLVRLFANMRREQEESAADIAEFKRRFVEYIGGRIAVGPDGDLRPEYPEPDDELEVAAVVLALELALENSEWAGAGIRIAEVLSEILPMATELDRIKRVHRILLQLLISEGDGAGAARQSISFARRMRDARRHQAAIDAYREAGQLAEQRGMPMVKAEAAFELGLLFESLASEAEPPDPMLADALAAMSDAVMTLRRAERDAAAVPVATNCARLARRLGNVESALQWAEDAVASASVYGEPDPRAHALFELGRCQRVAGLHDEAALSFEHAGGVFEEVARRHEEDMAGQPGKAHLRLARDRALGSAAVAASNASDLAPKGAKIGFLRLAAQRWERTSTDDRPARYATALVYLSAALAQAKDLPGARTAIDQGIGALPAGPDYDCQAAELRMRRVALRLLSGTSPDWADLDGMPDREAMKKLSGEIELLAGLSGGASPLPEADLRKFVQKPPQYKAKPYREWVAQKMGTESAQIGIGSVRDR